MKTLFSAAFIATTAVLATSANAMTTSEQISACAAALDERGVAAAAEYKPRFKSISGGGAKKLVLEMVPLADGEKSILATCKIKRGKVTDVTIKV